MIGFEAEENFFNEIKEECKNLKNVNIEKKWFGRETSLKEVIEKYNIDTNSDWYLSSDCEGDEKYMFQNKEEIELLKKCAHLAFEIHPRLAGISYRNFVSLILNNFKETHKIIRTYHGGIIGHMGKKDNSSFAIVRNDLYEKYLKDIVCNMQINKAEWRPGISPPEFQITFLN